MGEDYKQGQDKILNNREAHFIYGKWTIQWIHNFMQKVVSVPMFSESKDDCSKTVNNTLILC